MSRKIAMLLFSVFAYQTGIAMNQTEFLKNELHLTYKTNWLTMADAEKFAIEGRAGLIDGAEVNTQLTSVVLPTVRNSNPAQVAAMLLCANTLFTPYNPAASLACTREMLGLAKESNFDLAILLLKSQSLDGNSYSFPEKPTGASYKILEKAINMLKSEHNGHTLEAQTELDKLRKVPNETIKAIFSMLGI